MQIGFLIYSMDNPPQVIRKKKRRLKSPNMNILNFCIWPILEKKTYATSAISVNILKQRLMKVEQNILLAQQKTFIPNYI